jgi:hypothetical protein
MLPAWAFANTYTCQAAPDPAEPGAPQAMFQISVGSTVSVKGYSNFDQNFTDVQINGVPLTKSVTVNGPSDFQGQDFSQQSFQLLDRGSAIIAGHAYQLYMSQDIVSGQSQGMALYTISSASIIDHSDDRYVLSCVLGEN